MRIYSLPPLPTDDQPPSVVCVCDNKRPLVMTTQNPLSLFDMTAALCIEAYLSHLGDYRGRRDTEFFQLFPPVVIRPWMMTALNEAGMAAFYYPAAEDYL